MKKTSWQRTPPSANFIPALIVGAALGLFAAAPCRAASEEIQVYMDDLSAPGQFGLDVHNNFVILGTGAPTYPGELPPRHVYRLTPEFYLGLTKTLELGLYVLTTKGPQDNGRIEGGKMRLKYIAPHDTEAGFFWGLNFEAGRTSTRVSEMPWNAQLKGIMGYRSGPWTVAANPNLDWSLSKHGGPVTASMDMKVAYALASKTSIGFESYNELGPLSHLQALNRNSKTLYAVIDQEIGDIKVNVGLGRGLTDDADRWVLKFIVGTHF